MEEEYGYKQHSENSKISGCPLENGDMGKIKTRLRIKPN